MLIGLVHDSETVDDHVAGCATPRGAQAAVGEQWEPAAAVRAPELDNGVADQPTLSIEDSNRFVGLVPQCLWFDSAWLLGRRVVLGELSQAAITTQFHRERMAGLVG
ncbi:hypothetical protein [Rhodococcus sp. RD6.2]|uniref:hypothetical protein n=1 Tax=Rhodococcus sp. RD6.2 TaxID=260936 RepID=UPI00345F789D